jgi:hypothetical protein
MTRGRPRRGRIGTRLEPVAELRLVDDRGFMAGIRVGAAVLASLSIQRDKTPREPCGRLCGHVAVTASERHGVARAIAIKDALDAHTAMSTQALNSETVQQGINDVLLNNVHLYEALRAQGGD